MRKTGSVIMGGHSVETGTKMDQTDTFIKNLCNELAQPVTTLLLAVELVERGVASTQDIEAMRTEVERLNQIIQDLRSGQAPPDLASLTFLAA